MNEELNNTLAEMIREFADSMQGAAGFAIEQAPDVIQQLLMYQFVVSIACFAVMTAATLVLLKVYWVKSWRVAMEEWEDGGLCIFIPWVVWFVGYLVIGLGMDWLQIWLAPKVYLIEYAARLAS